MSVCERVWVGAREKDECVWVRERDSITVRDRVGENEKVWVCVCDREIERVWVFMREKERNIEYERQWERERERELGSD